MLILGGNIKKILQTEDAKNNVFLKPYTDFKDNKKKCSSCIPKEIKNKIFDLLKTEESVKQLFRLLLKCNKVEFYVMDDKGHKQLQTVEL